MASVERERALHLMILQAADSLRGTTNYLVFQILLEDTLW